MNQVPKGAKWDRIGIPIVIILAIFLISITIFLVLYQPTPFEPYGPPYTVEMNLLVDYNETSDIYLVSVSFSTDDPQALLKLDDVCVNLRNSHNENIREYIIADILDLEGGDIAYYDIDRNELLTVGDEFLIDGGIVESGSEFSIIYSKYGDFIIGVDLD